MQYKNVGFNSLWVSQHSFDEFVKQEGHHGFSKEEMQDIYNKCCAEHQVKPSPAKPPDKEKVLPITEPLSGAEGTVK